MYEDDKLVTVREMQQYLHCGREQLYKILQRPGCPKTKQNNIIYLPFYCFLMWYDKLRKHNKQNKESEVQYCVYRFLDKNSNVLYVGKTKKLKQRMAHHMSKGSNLDPECINNIAKVQYLIFRTECDMCLYEIYLINLYQPKYNIDVNSGLGDVILPVLDEWNDFDIKTMQPSKIENVVKNKQEKIYFDYDIFSNTQLENFINNHANSFLSEDDKKELAKLCGYASFDIKSINQYIVFNVSKAEVKIKDGAFYLEINPNGKHGYGGISPHNDRLLVFSIIAEGKRKRIYGKNRKEIADKMKKYITGHCVTTLSLDNVIKTVIND